MLDHKTSLNKFLKTKITACIFSDHNGIKLEVNKRSVSNYTNIWKLSNVLLNDQWVNEEIKRKNFKCLEKNEVENMIYQNLWDTAKAVVRGKVSKCLYQKINNLMVPFNELEKHFLKNAQEINVSQCPV
jgi:hypothetical protein